MELEYGVEHWSYFVSGHLSFLSFKSSLERHSTFFWSPQVSSSSLYPDLSSRLLVTAMRLLVPGESNMLFKAMELA